MKPTNGKCRPVKAELAVGGTASDILISLSSTSKLDVSVGLETSGIYGALLSLIPSQSTASNHGWFWEKKNAFLYFINKKVRTFKQFDNCLRLLKKNHKSWLASYMMTVRDKTCIIEMMLWKLKLIKKCDWQSSIKQIL